MRSGVSVIKAVIDTAAINRKSLPAKIIFDLSDRYQLIVSQAIVDEIEEVLNRSNIRAKFPQITDELVKQVVDVLTSAETVHPAQGTAPFQRPAAGGFQCRNRWR